MPNDLIEFKTKTTNQKYWMNIPFYRVTKDHPMSDPPSVNDPPSIIYPSIVSLKANNITHYLRWYGAIISTSPLRIYISQNPILVPMNKEYLPSVGDCFGISFYYYYYYISLIIFF